MPKRDPAEAILSRLRALEAESDLSVVKEELRRCLVAHSSRVVARAARLAAERSANDLGPELAAAFERLTHNGAKTDPGCEAKKAIVDALAELECDDVELFLRGARYVQMEPVWGKSVDTAADLRGSCVAALARCGYPDIELELVELLHDPEVQARRAGARIAAVVGGELLLRMKARAGDREPDVVGLCLAGLMTVAPARSLPFVTGFLEDPDPAVMEGAALALGESHDPQALVALLACWERNVSGELRQALALPIALSRQERAFDFLIEAVESGHRNVATAAVTALRLYRHEPARLERVRDAVDRRMDRELARAFRAAFSEEDE